MTTPSPLGFLLHIQSQGLNTPLVQGVLSVAPFSWLCRKGWSSCWEKICFFLPNVWLNGFCVCDTLTPSWRLLQHCLQGINLHLLYIPIICLAFGETDAANCLENLDNDLKGNQRKLWEENWGLCSVSQLDSVFSLFMGNKELENHCCTVQILNFYCPKLESISSVLNCLLLALV